jgi:prophage regulatory protein
MLSPTDTRNLAWSQESESMKILSIDELKTAKGIAYSKAHIWRLIRAGKFPQPIRLGENRIAFPEREIDAFLESKVTERDAKTVDA